ncbi:MAG: HAMP domain-containing sensor histidine kinase, partial [Campylobacterota bacterium]|nr:HAMP domain-containing sensor histidine kinase [Campylobacterota bacterium]
VLLIVVFVLYLSIKKRWLLTTTELQNEIEHQKTILEKQNKFIISQSRITAASEILENIAHQWRQPLSIVTTNMSSLKFSIEMDEEISKESLNTLANSVIKQSNYLSGIIDDFSSYFNNIDSSIEIYNVDDLLVQIENSYSYKFNENFVQYIKDIDDTCKIKINKSLFIQSLLVLYTNSIDAFKKNNIPHNGRYFFVKVINKSDNIIIKIKDSAGGIDDDCIEKIFEPYFTTKHKSIGTGIGLYMTHQIVTKQFHGTIKNENKVFEYDKKTLKGTEFIITLPL